jgi:ATP-dependent Clp protease ATP-binding subunit ClpB
MQLKNFSQAAQKVLIDCQAIAKNNHNSAVEPEHLALALLMTSEVKQLLSKKNLEYKALERALLELISELPVSVELDPRFSTRLIQALSTSEAYSLSNNNENILVRDILFSLLENKDKYGSLGAILYKYFLEFDNNKNQKLFMSDFLNIINYQEPVFGRESEIERIIQILSRKNCNNPLLIGEPGVGRSSIVYALAQRLAKQKVPTHLMTKEILTLNLGALVSGTTLRGQFEERIHKILAELASKPGQYILFVRDLGAIMGAGGEGASDAANLIKPALAQGEIQMIGLVTPDSYKKRIESDPSFARFFQPLWISSPSSHECERILAGLKNRYERFHGVFIEDDAIKASIDLGSKHLSGRILPEVAIDTLDEACSRHRIKIDKAPEILEKINTQLAQLELQKPGKIRNTLITKLEAQKKEAQKKYDHELSLIESMRALKAKIESVNKHIESFQERGDLKLAADMSQGSLAELKKELVIKQKELKKIKKSQRFIDPWVKREDIAEIISQETGIPVQKMMQHEREKLRNMEQILSAKVIAQDEAVAAVAAAIRRARVGLKEAKRPIGSFLFLGPTGVGKTELARELTNFLFDDERAMVRFDMSEFMERHSVARLIGAPPGYHGSDEGGQLTEAIRRKPYSIILFDEIEKAHADVLNILLQVLDEGRLTDSKGHLINFNNTVVIMTSNLGSEILLHEEVKLYSKEQLKSMLLERLLEHLRPELINRIDEIVFFNAIEKEALLGILNLMLQNLHNRLEQENFNLVINADVKNKLIEEGYSREFGARPLKRTIQRLLENPLAMLLVEGKFRKGDTIKVNLNAQKEINFEN